MGRLLIAVHSIAGSEAMFEETREWVKQRKAFGRRVADLQTIQHKLAELKTSIAVCRAFIDQCMELHDQKKLCGEMASMAKYWLGRSQDLDWQRGETIFFMPQNCR